jgi:hypothetical protein
MYLNKKKLPSFFREANVLKVVVVVQFKLYRCFAFDSLQNLFQFYSTSFRIGFEPQYKFFYSLLNRKCDSSLLHHKATCIYHNSIFPKKTHSLPMKITHILFILFFETECVPTDLEAAFFLQITSNQLLLSQLKCDYSHLFHI